MTRFAATAGAAVVLLGLVPGAQASSPVLHGSTVTNAGTQTGCVDAECRTFFSSGCPASLAIADGSQTSIIDVSTLGGQTLTFSYQGTDAQAYDAMAPYTLPTTEPPVSRFFFYVVASCVPPQTPVFSLSARPSQRSRSFTIPNGSKWLVAEPMDYASNVRWQAG